jgi:hypothetical protein
MIEQVYAHLNAADGYEAVMRMLTSDRRPRAVIVPERPQHGCPCALLAHLSLQRAFFRM